MTPKRILIGLLMVAAMPNALLTIAHGQRISLRPVTETNVIQVTFTPLPGFTAGTMAVLVGHTNFVDAKWVPFATNVTINLGHGGGYKDVWFGFRGLPDFRNKEFEFHTSRRIFVDLAPMEFHLKSPTNSVVTTPVVQIRGYYTRPIWSVSYDLTNTNRLARNQDAFVTAADEDVIANLIREGPKKFDKVDPIVMMENTNWIQCYDVQLANGTNTIQLRALDKKNVVWTNTFQLVLNLALLTNPPVVKLIWPQDGELVAGESVTLRGTVSASTGMVQASITPETGESENVEGLIERDGLFWLDDIPLRGTNHTLRITVTDVNGKSTKTNITLIRSKVSISVDDVPEQELVNPNVTVKGSINSRDHTVWVNGVRAVVDEKGRWTATKVPVTWGSMATFHTTAIPNSVNKGNGIPAPVLNDLLTQTNLFNRNPTAPGAPSR